MRSTLAWLGDGIIPPTELLLAQVERYPIPQDQHQSCRLIRTGQPGPLAEQSAKRAERPGGLHVRYIGFTAMWHCPRRLSDLFWSLSSTRSSVVS